jgi:hypothetical protein
LALAERHSSRPFKFEEFQGAFGHAASVRGFETEPIFGEYRTLLETVALAHDGINICGGEAKVVLVTNNAKKPLSAHFLSTFVESQPYMGIAKDYPKRR